MIRVARICFCALLAILVPTPMVIAAKAPLKVVCTIFPLTDIVRQIGGNKVTVTTLLATGVSEHTFEPTTGQMRQMADASLYVRVGAGMDNWGDNLLAAANRPPVIVTATAGIPLLKSVDQELVSKIANKNHHEEGDDPHVWLDPILVRDHIVPAVVTALSKISPTEGAYFMANGKNFSRALTTLDLQIRTATSIFRKRDFIALHGAWHYFGKRYGLTQIAAVEPFPGKEPSAKYMAALVSLARKNRVTIVFAEPQLSAKAAKVLAAELNGNVLLLDPLGGDNVPGRNGYIQVMRYNLGVIVKGMR